MPGTAVFLSLRSSRRVGAGDSPRPATTACPVRWFCMTALQWSSAVGGAVGAAPARLVHQVRVEANSTWTAKQARSIDLLACHLTLLAQSRTYWSRVLRV